MENESASKVDSEAALRLAVDQWGGIYAPYEAFYIQSIIYSSNAAVGAFKRYSQAVVNDHDAAELVSAIQEALTHAASLSRFFWPASKRGITRARGVKLRAAFDMDASPLENRELRNALEHFDERLDEFLVSGPTGICFPGPLVQPHHLADDKAGIIFRMVDPFEFIFVILGKKYEFYEVFIEVERILEVAKKYDINGGRLPLKP